MKGIDTNILVRFLVGDDETQAKKVYDIFKNAETARSELFVPLLVILELIWVLESVYSIPRHDILDALRELLLMPVLNFEHRPALHHFIQEESKYDLSDLLIAHAAKAQGCEIVMTFDRKAARFALFELVR